jgi:hypothetical protein
MSEEESEEQHAAVCTHPKVEIDAWGQRLRRIQCNQWMNMDGEWLSLPEADIAALRGVIWRRSIRVVDRQIEKPRRGGTSGLLTKTIGFGR